MKNNSQKGFVVPLVIAIVVLVLAAVVYVVWQMNTITEGIIVNNQDINAVACTQEAKLCPDGSYVGRTGPLCEFTACPSGDQSNSVQTNSTRSSITVLTPNGGETYKIGSQIAVGYNIMNVFSSDKLSMQIEKIGDSAYTQTLIEAPSNSFPETYWWTVPRAALVGNNYKITIRAKDSNGKIIAQDSSDNYFTITN